MKRLIDIFKQNWKIITLSYLLLSINSILLFIYPKVLGDTIDHLVSKDYYYVWRLVLLFISVVIVGYISRIYDTKVFSKIYRRFASIETKKQIDNNIDSSKINGRLSLMVSIVNFFESNVASIIQTFFGIVVSIYFLFMVSPTIVFYLIITGVVILFISYYFSPKIGHITKLSNDLSEEQTSIVSTLKINLINNLLRKSQKYRVDMSNINAKYYGLMEIVVYLSISSLLIYYVVNNNVTIGSVFSTYRYMFDFSNAVLGITNIIPSLINIKDVIKRLDLES